jgi:hypothetical protein
MNQVSARAKAIAACGAHAKKLQDALNEDLYPSAAKFRKLSDLMVRR